MGPIWGRQDQGGPLVGPMNIAIWAVMMVADYRVTIWPIMKLNLHFIEIYIFHHYWLTSNGRAKCIILDWKRILATDFIDYAVCRLLHRFYQSKALQIVCGINFLWLTRSVNQIYGTYYTDVLSYLCRLKYAQKATCEIYIERWNKQ